LDFNVHKFSPKAEETGRVLFDRQWNKSFPDFLLFLFIYLFIFTYKLSAEKPTSRKTKGKKRRISPKHEESVNKKFTTSAPVPR